jgi:hypothetical protein
MKNYDILTLNLTGSCSASELHQRENKKAPDF